MLESLKMRLRFLFPIWHKRCQGPNSLPIYEAIWQLLDLMKQQNLFILLLPFLQKIPSIEKANNKITGTEPLLASLGLFYYSF